MEHWRAHTQQSVDDSQLADSRPARRFADRQQTMTLGRPTRRQVQPVEDTSPPPPPPARMQSRKKHSTGTQDPGASPPPPPKPTSKPARPHPDMDSVSSLASNFETADETSVKSPGLPARRPQRKESQRGVSSGIAAARASLQAKLAGEQQSTTDTIEREPRRPSRVARPEIELPPRETAKDTRFQTVSQEPSQSANATMHTGQQSEGQHGAGPRLPMRKPSQKSLASMRAIIQARLAGEQEESTADSEPTRAPPVLPPKETSENTGHSRFAIPPRLSATRPAVHQDAIEKSYSLEDHRKQYRGEQMPKSPKSSKWPPANTQLLPAANRSTSTERADSPDSAEYDNITEENRGSPIKESSSVESMDMYDVPAEPQAPPLPPKTEDILQPVPRTEPKRTESVRSRVWKPRQKASEEKQSSPRKKQEERPSLPQEKGSQLHRSLSQRLSSKLEVQNPGNSQQPVDLSAMISKGINCLPMCVKVCHRFSSSTCESFSQHERLYVHFIKHCKVGVLKDEYSQEQYTIPISSALPLGLLYEGEGADASQYLKTAGDIMELKPLPVVVLATQPFDGGAPDKSVEANELLFVKKVAKTSILGKGKQLEVLTTDNKEKRLSPKCEGYFSIHPTHVQTTLSTLVEQFVSLPQRVYLYPSSEIEDYLTTTMTEQPVLLDSVRGESSVICTVKDDDSEDQVVFDVPTDSGIQLQAETITEGEEKQLSDTTSHLYHTLTPSMLKFIAEKPTQRECDLQCLLNKDLLPGKEMDGVHFQLPQSFSVDPPPPTRDGLPAQTDTAAEIVSIASSEGRESEASLVEDTGPDYEDVDSALAELPAVDATRLKKVISKNSSNSKLFKKLKFATSKFRRQEQSDKQDDDNTLDHASQAPTPQHGLPEPEVSYEPFTTEPDEPEIDHSVVKNTAAHSLSIKSTKMNSGSSSAETDLSQSNYTRLNNKIVDIVSELNALKIQVHKLSTMVESLLAKGTGTGATSRAVPPPSQQSRGQSDELTRNKQFLRSLSHEQVLQLLNNMGMSKYSVFGQRSVTGRQLVELDEQTLEDTYEMKRGFHRKKLMRIISGAIHAGTSLSNNN